MAHIRSRRFRENSHLSVLETRWYLPHRPHTRAGDVPNAGYARGSPKHWGRSVRDTTAAWRDGLHSRRMCPPGLYSCWCQTSTEDAHFLISLTLPTHAPIRSVTSVRVSRLHATSFASRASSRAPKSLENFVKEETKTFCSSTRCYGMHGTPCVYSWNKFEQSHRCLRQQG